MHFAGKITARGIYLPTHLQGCWKADEGQAEVKHVIWVQALLSLDNPARMAGLSWEGSCTGAPWVLFSKKSNTHPSEGSHIGLLGGASIPACTNSAQLLVDGFYQMETAKKELLPDQEKQERSLQISQSLSPHALCKTQLLSRPGPAMWMETIIFPTPSFRSPICFLKIYRLSPLPS